MYSNIILDNPLIEKMLHVYFNKNIKIKKLGKITLDLINIYLNVSHCFRKSAKCSSFPGIIRI